MAAPWCLDGHGVRMEGDLERGREGHGMNGGKGRALGTESRELAPDLARCLM